MSDRPLAAAAPRWDLLVRAVHWWVALAVLANYFLLEEGSLPHVWVGCSVLVLVLLRLLWGLVGTRPARFTSFPPSLSRALAHLRDMIGGRPRSYPSHNPLGSLMVYALWATLLVVAGSGLAMEGTLFPGAAAVQAQQAAAETAFGEVMEGIHGTAANLLLVLAALHVAGVLLESKLSGVNLARAMLTGGR